MESNDSKFCVSCGSKVNEESTVCSVCGKHVNENYEVKTPSKPVKNYLIFVAAFSLIYAVFSIVMGSSMISMTDAVIEALKGETEIWEELMNLTTEDELKNMMVYLGAAVVLSGVFAAITGILSALKKYYIIALICCIISTLLGAIILIGLAGIIIAVLIVSSKYAFKG